MRKKNRHRLRVLRFDKKYIIWLGAFWLTVLVIATGWTFLIKSPAVRRPIDVALHTPDQTLSKGSAAISRSASLYADASSSLADAAAAWANQSPKDTATMQKLVATPLANWFGAWSGDIQSATNGYVTGAYAAGKIPMLVAYNIPGRDCGSYSKGGAANAVDYEKWITNFAVGIGKRQAIIIVEPDAIDELSCYSKSQQTIRLRLLAYAVHALDTQTKAAVYLDAGHPGWEPTSVIADRLEGAGISGATGFSLNVSNFDTTNANISYGNAISKQVGGKHYVVDTSRNGNGPFTGALGWCNPPGRAFGHSPTLNTGNSIVDAYLWVKNPGISDGNCGASELGTVPPNAGGWWPQYVLSLASGSGWPS